MFRTTIALLACVVLATPALAAKSKHRKVQEVQSKDSIQQDYTKADGEICYKQVIMVTGKGRPGDAWAELNAKKLWQSTVKAIHGERFIDPDRANHPDGGKGVKLVQLPASLNTTKYVVQGKPCAVSF